MKNIVEFCKTFFGYFNALEIHSDQVIFTGVELCNWFSNEFTQLLKVSGRTQDLAAIKNKICII